MSSLGARLDALRGSAQPLNHTARTLLALSANPGCARRAVLDATGADKDAIAARVGYPARGGGSVLAFTRGGAFEARVKANGAAELRRLLRETLGVDVPDGPDAPYDDLGAGGGDAATGGARGGEGGDTGPGGGAGQSAGAARGSEERAERYERTREALLRAARGGEGHASEGRGGALFDHPMLRLAIGGHTVYLEPDLLACRVDGRFHVIEIKSIAIIDGQADGVQVAAAARQAAVYVLALRAMLAEAGLAGGSLVSDSVILVGRENFSVRPAAAMIDARTQVSVLRRQFQRLAGVDALIATLPPGVCFDPAGDGADLAGGLRRLDAHYVSSCLTHCQMAGFCRAEARTAGSVDVLGSSVRDDLGGVDTIDAALGLAYGDVAPEPEQAEMARALRHAARLRAELVGGPA